MPVRIGIDVGGTFTDAVAIDNTTFEVIGSAKVPTTHSAPEGVAAGIVQALHQVMESEGIAPDDVVFIAHGTTQATNALLEGDVATVGVLTLGSGLQGAKSRSDTTMGRIELAEGKELPSTNQYVDASDDGLAERIDAALDGLRDQGAQAVVAAEAFSVDDPAHEALVVDRCAERGVPATATNEISKLYGLKVRTRTAVVNASIMPKMLEAATMTERSIRQARIPSPLMVMRCDGGVMTVDEVRRRPILTILSGPAAGVAGALRYERLTDGVFFEVGGTSTDISCVKDGQVMVTYAEVGGHKTYLSSLDVRTVGIGGGSMVQIRGGRAVGTGPRSAHIAGIDYEVYADAGTITNPRLVAVRPLPGDPEYAVVECDGGARVCLTMAGAANIVGLVGDQDYARGDVEAARRAWAPLAESMGCSVEEAAETVLALASQKNAAVASQLMRDYHLDPRTTVFVGGGGGAAAVVPHLARTMGHRHRLARNAAVISTIGVAMAMVRDMVERSVVNPTDEDVIAIRREAELKAIQSGAAPGTVEVTVEVDSQRNMVRAVAVGATEMRAETAEDGALGDGELLATVAENLDLPASELTIAARTDQMLAVTARVRRKRLFGLLSSTKTPVRLIDASGVIRLQKANARVWPATVASAATVVDEAIDELTVYNDGGANYPNLHLVVGGKTINLSGLSSEDQIRSLAGVELQGYDGATPLIVIGTTRLED